MSNYKVGRGKPPVHTRFKPGNQEWKKRGPKQNRSKTFDPGSDLKAALSTMISIKRNGKITREIQLQGIIDKFVADALQGSISAANDLLSFRLNAEELGDMQDIILHFDAPGDSNP